MEENVKAYRNFIDWLTDTSGANFYSKKDLENYQHSAKLAIERDEQLLSEIYVELGPLFNSLTENQKNAFGCWGEHLYYQGIINCLEQIQLSDDIVLAYKKAERKLEVIEGIEYGEDFIKRHKVSGAAEWEN